MNDNNSEKRMPESPTESAAAGQNSRFSFTIDKYALLKERHGERYVEYRRRWSPTCDEGPTDFPLEINIATNKICNLRCVICPLEEQYKSSRDIISQEVLDRILAEATEHRLSSIDLCSGEPMAHKPSFFAALEMAKKTPVMDLFVHTNGTLLSEDILDTIIDPRVTTLNVSIDAATREVHDAVRGKNHFDKVRRGLERVAELKQKRNTLFPVVQLSFCVSPPNLHERVLFEDAWKGLGQFFQYQSYLWKKGVNIDPSENFVQCKPEICREPDIRCMIAPNGDMYPCCTGFQDELRVGNILESTIHELWRSEKMNRLRASLKGDAADLLDVCSVCRNSYYEPAEA